MLTYFLMQACPSPDQECDIRSVCLVVQLSVFDMLMMLSASAVGFEINQGNLYSFLSEKEVLLNTLLDEILFSLENS